MKNFISTILCLSVMHIVYSQIEISSEFRPRTEYSHGYKSLALADQEPSLFTSQRTRLNLKFQSDKLNTFLSLQDVRIWGGQAQLVGNEDFATTVHQAWAEVLFNKKIGLRIGRQELAYDNHRIFGNVGWAQQARSHDLALLKYAGEINAHLGVAYHQNSTITNNLYNGPDAYKSMQFLWLNRKKETYQISLLFLNNGLYENTLDTLGNITEQKIKYNQTIGLNGGYSISEELLINGWFYYQIGYSKTHASNSLKAFNGSLDIQYKKEYFTTNIGYEYLSGTDYNDTINNYSFSPLFGTNHKFNGYMDYFYVGNHANNIGLQDIYIKAAIHHQGIVLGAHYHAFLAAANIDNEGKGYLGSEIDITAKYKMTDNIAFQIGYSHLIASERMELIKGGDRSQIQNWGYIMLSFTPKYLLDNKKLE